VYLLGELDTGDAARLFEERAVAAGPCVKLTERLVTAIVGRLDGLPLAIELAAARARTMTLEEIDRRLGDRFALLRGGDRSAPGRHQTLFAGIDALAAEEVNLADELRAALADGDRGALVQLLAALGFFWTVRGEHARLMVLATAVASALRDWVPPPELAYDARGAVMITLSNAFMTTSGSWSPLRAILQRLSEDAGDSPLLYGLMQVLLAFDPADGDLAAFAGRWSGSRTALTGRPRCRPASGSATCARTPATRRARSRRPSGRWRWPAPTTARGRPRCRGPCWPSWPCT